MKMNMHEKVIYTGPDLLFENVHNGDFGYIVDVYDDGACEVDFYSLDGTTKALIAVPQEFLGIYIEKTICPGGK